MPKGILTQFIVSMHALIMRRQLVWRAGVVLERDLTTAEVIEYYGKREVQIRIVGKHKRDLMILVAYELEKIHATYKNLA
jgi:internalin A